MPTDFPTAALYALTALTASALLAGVRRADRAAGGRPLFPLAAAALALWLAFAARLALAGKLLDFSAMPPPAMRILVPGLALAFLAALSPLGARLARHLSYAALIGFHAFRLPLEWLLHTFYAQGRLPVQMTWSGRNFDVITGASAIVVATLAAQSRAGRKTALAWGILGFGLLLNIMGVAILSLPGPLRRFPNDPPNELVLHFPYVFIPAFFVMAAFAGHLVLFRKVLRDR